MVDEGKQQFVLHLDVDTGGQPLTGGSDDLLVVARPDLSIRILEDDEASHGFGLAEAVTIVISVGVGVASDLIASSIKESIRAVIRRVKGAKGEDDGTIDGLTRLIETERQSEDGDHQATEDHKP